VVMERYIKGDIKPYSLLKVIPLLSSCFMLVSCLAYNSTLEIEVTCSSEMLVDFQWTT
jgi:hypothetical protein